MAMLSSHGKQTWKPHLPNQAENISGDCQVARRLYGRPGKSLPVAKIARYLSKALVHTSPAEAHRGSGAQGAFCSVEEPSSVQCADSIARVAGPCATRSILVACME